MSGPLADIRDNTHCIGLFVVAGSAKPSECAWSSRVWTGWIFGIAVVLTKHIWRVKEIGMLLKMC